MSVKREIAEICNMPMGYTDPMLKGYRFDVLEDKREKLSKLSPENRKKYSQKEVARIAGHDYDWYQKIMRWGADPSWTDILTIAAYVGVNLECLRPSRILLRKDVPIVTAEEVEKEKAMLSSPPKFPRVEYRKGRVAEKPAPYGSGKKR